MDKSIINGEPAKRIGYGKTAELQDAVVSTAKSVEELAGIFAAMLPDLATLINERKSNG